MLGSLSLILEMDSDVIRQTSILTLPKVEMGTKTWSFIPLHRIDSDEFWTMALPCLMAFDQCFVDFLWTTFKKYPDRERK